MESSLPVAREEEEHQPFPPISISRVSEMENLQTAPEVAEGPLSTAWEWDSFLDFAIEDPSILSWDSEDRVLDLEPEPAPAPVQISQSELSNLRSNRVRKRDPRITCENFLAGRVPCACPELDEKEEEEEQQIGKKRSRRAPTGPRAGVRCQVPGCEADIRELKGYHRRHRVCLRCANSAAVMLGGEPMRYCQQCGK